MKQSGKQKDILSFEPLQIVIPGRPVTKKNSQRLIMAGGRIIPIPSKQYKDYEARAITALREISGVCIDEPVNVKCLYYMPDRRRVDLTNLLEATCDLLVHYDVLSDDNCKIVVSHDGSRVLYDKENPRAEIEITPVQG